jgi:hypothetical protein
MRKIAIAVVACATAGAFAFGADVAAAGIGANDLAPYAKQGIVNELNAVYGSGGSPYNVSCSATGTALNATITCKVTEK